MHKLALGAVLTPPTSASTLDVNMAINTGPLLPRNLAIHAKSSTAKRFCGLDVLAKAHAKTKTSSLLAAFRPPKKMAHSGIRVTDHHKYTGDKPQGTAEPVGKKWILVRCRQCTNVYSVHMCTLIQRCGQFPRIKHNVLSGYLGCDSDSSRIPALLKAAPRLKR